MNRRALAGACLAAIPAGAGAGMGLRWWMSSGGTIRFLGREAAMIALFDTGKERVLLLLGEPDAAMLDHLSQLHAVGRARIDMLVGSHRWLTTAGLRTRLNLHETLTLSLQSSASAPPIRGNIYPVVSNQRVHLGHSSDMLLRPGSGNSAQTVGAGTNPGYLIELTCEGTRLVLASHADALVAITPQPHLLAVPGEVDASQLERFPAGMLVGTSRPTTPGTPYVQTFYNEPLTFFIRDGSVGLRRDQFFS